MLTCVFVHDKKHTGKSPTKGHEDDEGTVASLLPGKAQRAGTIHPGMGTEGWSYKCIQTPEGRLQRGRSFWALWVVPSDRTKDNGRKPKHGRFCLNIGKHFFTEHGHRVPREWSLHPWRYYKAIWTWSLATGCRWLWLSKDGWTRWPLQVPSNLKHSGILGFLYTPEATGMRDFYLA